LENMDKKGRNMMAKTSNILGSQSGAALVIALIMIVVISLIGLASSYTSIFEIAMSGNKRGITDAFYAADTGISALIAYPTISFNTSGWQNPLILTTATVYQNFSFTALNIPNPTNIVSSNATITWLQNVSGPPRGGGYSAVNVNYAYFQVQCTGNDTQGSGAQNTVQEEVIEIIPIAQQ